VPTSLAIVNEPSHYYLFQDEPFTSHEPDAIFHMSKFLIHALIEDSPAGISKVYPHLLQSR